MYTRNSIGGQVDLLNNICNPSASSVISQRKPALCSRFLDSSLAPVPRTPLQTPALAQRKSNDFNTAMTAPRSVMSLAAPWYETTQDQREITQPMATNGEQRLQRNNDRI